MACPFVAGLVALLPERDPKLDPDRVTDLLRANSPFRARRRARGRPPGGTVSSTPVDYRKIDAAPAAAPDDEGPPSLRGRPAPELAVFVSPAAATRRRTDLARLGVPAGSLLRGAHPLPPEQVRELSEQPWVRPIRLSRPLDTL